MALAIKHEDEIEVLMLQNQILEIKCKTKTKITVYYFNNEKLNLIHNQESQSQKTI